VAKRVESCLQLKSQCPFDGFNLVVELFLRKAFLVYDRGEEVWLLVEDSRHQSDSKFA
jgi:hypothetical protein